MRFETPRALDWAATFAFPRASGSDGERRAADIAAEELARLGLRVERVALSGSRLPDLAEPWLGWLGVAAWATALTLATRLDAPWPVRLAPAFGALLWLRLTAVEGFGFLRAWRRRVATTNVIAWRVVEPPPPLRVVFHTALDAFDPGRSLVPAWLSTRAIGAILAAQVFCDLTIHRNPLGLPPGWRGCGLIFLALLWALIVGRIWRLVRRRGDVPEARDNRTGLALLLEMARTWPRTTSARIETRFVATGGRSLDHAGLRALVHAIGVEWPARPTLVVDWLAPGVGPGLDLLEEGTCTLAATAATDLWIPHHVIHHAAIRREHWPFGRHGPGYVGMVGGALGPAVDPDALARAAQLATEVALRWARRKQPPGKGVESR